MTPQNAFAPGSPAGGEIITDKPMTLPPLQFSSTAASSAKSGDIGMTQTIDHSGMIVNYGAGSSLGAATFSPWLIAAAVVGYLVWKKKFS